MTQARRVTRTSNTPRTARPAAMDHLPMPSVVEHARSAVVTPLFPEDNAQTIYGASPFEAAQVTNIFADLADDIEHSKSTPLARARARMAARMPGANIPAITNIFDENCPDVSDEIMAEVEAKVQATPRKMVRARAELAAGHQERAARAQRLRQVSVQQAGRIAAGMALVATILHIAPLPNA